MKPRFPFGERTRTTIAAVLFLLAAFSLGFYTRGAASASFAGNLLGTGTIEPPETVDLAPLWRAWAILNQKYVPAGTSTTITQQEMLWGAIEGLAASLGDPYTVFFPPVESEIFQDDIRGSFGGVGMEIGIRNGILTVIAPLKNTPAERAGIKAGDQIIRIEGESTEGVSVEKAVSKIRGEVGTNVTLTIARVDEGLLDVEITRGLIEIPTIEYERRDDGIFVIRLFNFSGNASAFFRGALREFVNSNTNKLIIDLRNNPGGYLESSVEIASWFLPLGRPIVREDFGGTKEEEVYRSHGYNPFNENLRVVILVNEGSASASEILAGALQDYGKAIIVGEKTFGKGSVQELVAVTADTSLKVTIAQWLTPNGRSISDGGIVPDHVVPRTSEDIEADRDPQLQKAVELLNSGPILPVLKQGISL